jgi:hypothetical protein
MLRENLKDSGEIIENILTQPLSVPGAAKEVSLLEAAQNYDPQSPLTSDLHKIMLSFLQFPEPTEMMIRELELLQEDLKTS